MLEILYVITGLVLLGLIGICIYKIGRHDRMLEVLRSYVYNQSIRYYQEKRGGGVEKEITEEVVSKIDQTINSNLDSNQKREKLDKLLNR